MLQVSNADDGKSEWNVNETHIIIPMIDGDVIAKEADKIPTGTITLNALEGGDQAVLANGLEHSFVIGLDRNLFETHSNKSDLLVIQNSDLKLLSCGPDLKAPVAYALSYVDQDRSEILWESPVLKERSRPDWCHSEKAIFEVKDVLSYDDAKNWRDDLEKGGEQINLDEVTKIGGEILIPVEDTLAEGKKPDLERDTHYIVNYYPAVQNCEAISILPNSAPAKPVTCVGKNDSRESKPDVPHVQADIVSEVAVGFDESVPMAVSNDFVQYETDTIEESQQPKDCIVREDGVSGTLPEKSLPLKKKAKMKRTVGLENQRSALKQDSPTDTQQDLAKSERKSKHSPVTSVQENDSSDSDEPLIKRVNTQRKETKRKSKTRPTDSPAEEEDQKEIGSKSEQSVLAEREPANEPSDIFALVEGLRKCRMIKASVWQTLNSGLRELNVDILREMKARREDETPPKSSGYSAQLKAFALVLYFKQPAAFNHLAKVYRNGWPSLNVIKEWKRRMNNHQRPNFVGIPRETLTKS